MPGPSLVVRSMRGELPETTSSPSTPQLSRGVERRPPFSLPLVRASAGHCGDGHAIRGSGSEVRGQAGFVGSFPGSASTQSYWALAMRSRKARVVTVR